MNKKNAARILAAAAVPVALAGSAAAALASPGRQSAPKPVTAATQLSNRDDSGGNGNWAKDTLTRTLTIRETGHAGGLYYFTATIRDAGTFRAIKYAHTPNQGRPYTGDRIVYGASGPMSGSASYSFTASTLPSARLVPRHVSGDADSTSTWYELAFKPGTTFAGTGIGAWSWHYSAAVKEGRHVVGQHWTDAYSNDAGQIRSAGNIN